MPTASAHPAFDILDRQTVSDIQSEVILYRHRTTGAEVLSVINDDRNKVFGIALRTPTLDSTGVAHILEHTVLCGSEKYPVKDPFKELMQGSLYTFLNAMTYPDKTIYPVASQNLKDFYNLVDVYIDAVFFPRLERGMFEQEGWHLELTAPDAAPAYKGVVYNEMKGVYSSPDNVVYRTLSRKLHPDANESHDSGGYPPAILDLTHEGLVNYHRSFYHPSNARIYFYGDDDPAARLERLEQTLSRFESRPESRVESTIIIQSPFAEPRDARATYQPSTPPAGPRGPSGEDDDGDDGENVGVEAPKSYVITGWILGDAADLERNLALNLLAYLLQGPSGAPLRKALIDSGLGDDLAGYGMDTGGGEVEYTVGLRGVAPENVPAVQELILSTLRDLAETGFDPAAIEAAFNSTEFALREQNTGSSPRGLVLFIRTLNHWLYDRDPIAPLHVRPLLEAFKKRLAEHPTTFQDLIREHLLDNPHRLQLCVDPDPEHATREAAKEATRLAKTTAALTDADRAQHHENTAALLEAQETPESAENLATIPRLGLSDLDPKIPTTPREVHADGDLTHLHHALPTNDIAYVEIAFDATRLPDSLVPLLPLYGRVLLEHGTAKHDYVTLAQNIARTTGGITFATNLAHPMGADHVAYRLLLRAKVIRDKASGLFDLFREILHEPKLDHRERFHQLVLEEKAYEESTLIPYGNRIVAHRLRAPFSSAGWIQEQISGLTYLRWVRDLLKRVETDWASVLADLQRIHALVITRNNLATNLTHETPDALRPEFDDFLGTLPGLPADAPAESNAFTPPEFSRREAIVTPSQINYVGWLLPLAPHGYEPNGHALVANRHVRIDWLWNEVRVKGGAYGSGASLSREQRTLCFTSYRDPNLAETLDAYRRTAHFLASADISADQINQTIIGTIGGTDPCRLPGAQGHASFMRHLNRITDEYRQGLRDQILSTSRQHLREFGDLLAAAESDARFCALTSEKALERSGLEDVQETRP